MRLSLPRAKSPDRGTKAPERLVRLASPSALTSADPWCPFTKCSVTVHSGKSGALCGKVADELVEFRRVGLEVSSGSNWTGMTYNSLGGNQIVTARLENPGYKRLTEAMGGHARISNTTGGAGGT